MHSDRHGSDLCGPKVRWLALIAIILSEPATEGMPAPAAFNGIVSFADGGPFTLVRRDTLMSGSRGVELIAGDLLETGPKAFLVVQAPEGTLIGVGPSTAVYFFERGQVATLFVLKGWVKADVRSASMRILGTHLGMQGHEAVMVLYADERSDAAFDEQGSATVLLPGVTPKPLNRDLRPNRFFVREERLEVVAQPSPTADFVARMPVAFRDPLPAYQELPDAQPPRVLRPVDYADIRAWLTVPHEWRDGFVRRFRGRLKDPAFFAAMDAHLALFPEWTPVLHPPLPPESGPAADESRSSGIPAPHKTESQQADEPR